MMVKSTPARAAVVTTPGAPVEIWKYQIPPPSPGCINIKVVRAGVCGTDCHLWEGDSVYPEPFILGHEGLGVITELGEGVTSDHSSRPVKIGDVVYWNPIRPCYSCYDCTVQRDLTGCNNGTFFSPAKAQTTWASYTTIATLQPSNSFYCVDPDVPYDAFIALGCALPTMLKGLENLGPILPNRSVLVQGCGAVGLAAIMLARLAGAKPIICVDANQRRLEMAERFGADVLINMKDEQFLTTELRANEVSRAAGPRGVDLGIECSGHAAAVEEGLQLLARNARYLLVGTWAGAGTVPLSPFQVVHKALKIIGTTYASPENYFQAARLVEANHTTFPLAECVTHRYLLEEVVDAFKTVQSGVAIKAVVMPQGEWAVSDLV